MVLILLSGGMSGRKTGGRTDEEEGDEERGVSLGTKSFLGVGWWMGGCRWAGSSFA